MKNDGNCKYEHKAVIGYTLDGKPIRKSFYGKSKREAKQKADNYIIDNGRAEKNPAGKITFSQLQDMFMDEKSKVIRQNSFEKYISISRVLNNRFADIPMSQINKREVTKFATDLAEKYSQPYVRQCISNMSAVFQYGIDNELLTTNPCKGVRFKSKKEKKERHVYTEAEADAIIDYTLRHPEAMSVHIMLSYGTTISETLGIQYDDVDFEAGTITIKRSITRSMKEVVVDEPKNKHRKRIIAVSQSTLDYIKRVHDPEYKYLVHAESKTEPYNPQHWRWQIYDKTMKAVQICLADRGIDIAVLNPHELRHSRATIWVEKNVNLFAIAEEMGWSDLEMLKKVYGHPDIQKIKGMLGLDKEKSQPE